MPCISSRSVTDGISQPVSKSKLVMGYFITNLSFNLWWKNFLNRWKFGEVTVVSHAPFALDFCPHRWRTRQISKMTCVWRTETVMIVVVLMGRLMWVHHQQVSNCCIADHSCGILTHNYNKPSRQPLRSLLPAQRSASTESQYLLWPVYLCMSVTNRYCIETDGRTELFLARRLILCYKELYLLN